MCSVLAYWGESNDYPLNIPDKNTIFNIYYRKAMEITSVKTHLRLSQLTATVAATVNKAFAQQQFWVVADVTSHTFKADSDYHYFDLVEKDPNSNRLIA